MRAADLLRDVRDAVRSLGQQRRVTLVVIAILAVCIGANSAIYSILQRLVLRPFPGVPRQDRLVAVGMWDGTKDRCCGLSVPDLEDLQQRTRTMEDVLGARLVGVNIGTADRPAYAGGQLVTANFFDVARVPAMFGRTFAEGEDREGAAPVAVISERLWRGHFGADRTIVGRAHVFNGRPFTIVGVVPQSFRGMFVGYWIDVWLPLSASDRFFARGSRLDDRADAWLNGYARLREGATVAQADAEVRSVAHQLAREQPQSNGQRRGGAFPMSRSPYGATPLLAPAMAVLMAVVFVVLLIGCANIAGLQLVRALARTRELAVRAALGASPGRVGRGILIENLLLALAGGAVGLVLAYWLSDVATVFVPPRRVRVDLSGQVDGGVLAVTAALSILTAAACGLLPALQARRLDLGSVLKEESAGASAGRARVRLREALVVVQICLCVVLCVTSALFVRQVRALGEIDPGFDDRGLLFASYNFFSAGYDAAEAPVLLEQIATRLRGAPGITSVSYTSRVPLSLGDPDQSEIRIDGYAPAADEKPSTAFTAVGPAYFDTMRTRVLAGRDFDGRDARGAALVCAINARLRETYFRGADPLGRRLHLDGQWRTIVAVVADGKSRRLGERPAPHAFVPILQSDRTDGSLIVRTSGENPLSAAGVVRQTIASIAPRLTPFLVTIDDHMRTAAFGERLAATLTAALGAFSVLLSMIGVHAVVSHSVSRRARELAIRMALGATAADVRRLVVRRGAVLAAAGIALGAAGAFACSRALRDQLAATAPFDAGAYGISIALIGSAALLASWIPSLRAGRIAPVDALH